MNHCSFHNWIRVEKLEHTKFICTYDSVFQKLAAWLCYMTLINRVEEVGVPNQTLSLYFANRK